MFWSRGYGGEGASYYEINICMIIALLSKGFSNQTEWFLLHLYF